MIRYYLICKLLFRALCRSHSSSLTYFKLYFFVVVVVALFCDALKFVVSVKKTKGNRYIYDFKSIIDWNFIFYYCCLVTRIREYKDKFGLELLVIVLLLLLLKMLRYTYIKMKNESSSFDMLYYWALTHIQTFSILLKLMISTNTEYNTQQQNKIDY